MAAVADRIRHEISRQVGVKGIHRYLVGGDGAEPNKAVQPHEDGIAPLRSLLSRQSPGLSSEMQTFVDAVPGLVWFRG